MKEIAEKEHQIPAATAKLIMKGKIMEDEKDGVAQTLKDYNIQDGGFIVVMSQKVSSPEPTFPVIIHTTFLLAQAQASRETRRKEGGGRTQVRHDARCRTQGTGQRQPSFCCSAYSSDSASRTDPATSSDLASGIDASSATTTRWRTFSKRGVS